jgi:signal transduction histidine kinase
MIATTTSNANILIVDDVPANLELLSSLLTERGYDVRPTLSGAMALKSVQAAPPDLILLDINMPKMNGYEVCNRLKADETTRDIPVIFISALDETVDKIKAFGTGGLDYVTKPFQIEEVVARIETHLALRSLQKQLQSANHALEERNQQLEQANAELEAFAHTVAHDLKNPLNTVVGYGELLTGFEGIAEEKRQRYIQLIVQTGYKMSNIISSLLLLAKVRRLDQLQLKPLDMAQVVTEAQKRLAFMIEDYQAEVVVPDREAWPVALGYASWVEEVWANYISNALKYGGQPPRVKLGATLQDDTQMIRFWVRDNGSGLSPEEQAKLFIPFTRIGQAQIEGHGLGLSIVQRIVEKLGGEVSVESVVGQGSVFSFSLPAV